MEYSHIGISWLRMIQTFNDLIVHRDSQSENRNVGCIPELRQVGSRRGRMD
jgi:hypothetical protein